MDEIMNPRLRQVYVAMGETYTTDLSAITTMVTNGPDNFGLYVDFKGGMSEAKIRNIVDTYVANIAQLRDHSEHWCKRNHKPWKGIHLLKTNRDVGLIQDLFNRNKHFDLTRSWTGLFPDLGEVNRVARVTCQPGKEMFMTINPKTGILETRGGGELGIAVDAQVKDNQGNIIGMLGLIAERAIVEWEKLLIDAGVPLPLRT